MWEETLGLAQRAPFDVFLSALSLMLGPPQDPQLAARLADHWDALVRCALDPLDSSDDDGAFVSKAAFLALMARFGPVELLRTHLADLLHEGEVVPWFHGARSRVEAEAALMRCPGGEGGMLVRFSSRAPDRLVVSTRAKAANGGKVRHSFVQNGPAGFSLDGVGAPFPSLLLLVQAVGLPFAAPTPLRLVSASPRRRAQLLLDLDWAALGLGRPAEPRESCLALLRAAESSDSALRRGLEQLLPSPVAPLAPVLRALLVPQPSAAGVARALGLATSTVTHADVVRLFAEAPPSPPPPPPPEMPPPGRLIVPAPEEAPVFRSTEHYCDGLASEYDVMGASAADGDGVTFAPYAPKRLPLGAVSEVAVWACLAAEREALLQRLRGLDEACPPACCPDDVFHGQLVTVELHVPPPLSLQGDGTKHLVWTGEPGCCQFAVLVDAQAGGEDSVPCLATVLVGRLVISLRFSLRLGEAPPEVCALSVDAVREEPKLAGRIIARSQLRLLEEIGRGASAVAYLAELDGDQVVVKQFVEGSAAPDAVASEWRILQLLGRHPNVVQCLGVVEGPALVLEYAARGSLDVLLQDRDVDDADAGPEQAQSGFSFDDRVGMARDAVRGLAHLHSAGIVHRDVAARNCLLQADGRVVLSDFGMAAERPPNAADGALLTGSARGPLRWMAPEQLRPPYVASYKSDVWAAGVLVWELLSGARPALAPEQVVAGQRLPMNGEWPAKLRELLARCFEEDPARRPSSVQLLQQLSPLYSLK